MWMPSRIAQSASYFAVPTLVEGQCASELLLVALDASTYSEKAWKGKLCLPQRIRIQPYPPPPPGQLYYVEITPSPL